MIFGKGRGREHTLAAPTPTFGFGTKLQVEPKTQMRVASEVKSDIDARHCFLAAA
jgi:hypothetical protein